MKKMYFGKNKKNPKSKINKTSRKAEIRHFHHQRTLE